MHIFRPRPDLPVSQRPYRGFFSDTLEFLEGEMLETGSFYRVPFPWFPLTVTTDPEVVKQVLQSNHFNYVKSPAYRQLKLAVGKGLVTSEGEHWKRQRQLAQPAFYKSRLKGLYETMAQVAESYVNEWEVRLQKDPHADVSLEMMQLTAQIVLRALFSSEANLDLTRLYDLIVEAQDYVMFRTLQPLQIPLQYLNGRHRKFVKAKQSFDEVVFRLIEERRLQVDPPDDLLTMLVEAQLEGVGMTNEDLRDELLTLFFAGHETSANALAWTLYLLAHHPEVVSQLRSEIETVVGGDIPTWEDLPKLTYTRMVVEEGMRLFPPAYGIGRQAIQEDVLNGVKIHRGTVVFIAIYAMHRNPEHWEDPNAFRPERFSAAESEKRHRLAYMPFGMGPRMCIGNHFAMMEMQLLLSLLVSRFDFVYEGTEPPPADPLVTLRPREGMPMNVQVRAIKVPR